MRVKPLILTILTASFLASGCANLNLARFAPPGFVKYEDIASKKPPNPAIVARVADRAEVDGEYPVLSETPAAGEKPTTMAADRRDALAARLVERRAALEQNVTVDRAAADAEREILARIAEERQRRDEEISAEMEKAQDERREPLPKVE